ncbi:hypothetical protein PT285_06860 [Lactobacillus sp. ESL0791]|uniref:hypothetical protein n=1 Tax=Lactobacillus sp. ESL0791 TaxID=2983234 RepID=UPI0023F68AAC|nr:hypothetical protein [Lactobacillus sp. ESL0791]MDF7639120.1 hypothetical protein [Lactobacillus sp. ESL0791]
MEKEHETTIRESLLTPKLYKIVGVISLVELVIAFILPFFKHIYWCFGLLAFQLLTLADLFTTFFQKHRINFLISLFLGNVLAIIVCIALFVYILFASGNVVFAK